MAREQVLRFRCTAGLAQAVEQAATDAGMGRSDWLRLVIRAALQQPEDTRALVQRLDGLLQHVLDAASEAQTTADRLVEGHLGIAEGPSQPG